MSDMRLTSSKTKMKINLCIFLLCNTAVSVFGKPQKLNSIVGKSVNFTAAVKIDGKLMHSGVLLGDVTGGSFTRASNSVYNGRVRWDSSTGYFSLSGLKEKDSGEYKVENTDQHINTVFQLNVYIPVSKPYVKMTHDKPPCTILCTVEQGMNATLSWYRDGQYYGISPVGSAPHLYLTDIVESSSIYTCEAKNSVSRETSDSFPVEASCTGGAAGIWQTEGSKMWSLCLVLIAMVYSHLV